MTEEKKAELLPCAHCGNAAIIGSGKELYQAFCLGCGAETKLHISREHAARAWNRRAPDPKREAERAVIEAAKACRFGYINGKAVMARSEEPEFNARVVALVASGRWRVSDGEE